MVNPAVIVLLTIAIFGLILTVAGWIYRELREQRQLLNLTQTYRERDRAVRVPAPETVQPQEEEMNRPDPPTAAAFVTVIVNTVPPAARSSRQGRTHGSTHRNQKDHVGTPRPETVPPVH